MAQRDLDPLFERQLRRTHLTARFLHRGRDLALIESKATKCGRRIHRAFRDRERVVSAARKCWVCVSAVDHERARVKREVMAFTQCDQVVERMRASLAERVTVMHVDVPRRATPRNTALAMVTCEHPATQRGRDLRARALSRLRVLRLSTRAVHGRGCSQQ